MTLYAEHEKLEKISDKSQSIGEFMEWLQGKFLLCKYSDPENKDIPVPQHVNLQELLAEYFGIDLQQIEFEKRLMLKRMRDRTVPIKTGDG